MSKNSKGWVQGMIGVAIFAGSLPATRLAVRGFDPVFLTGVRALIAALLGAALLWLLRQRPPERKDLPALALTALGVVAGFPLLTALALQQASAARAMVFVGLLPLCTALFAVWRGGERPRPAFWLFSGAGALCVSAYAALDGSAGSILGDLMMLGAVLICGLGYAEGAGLARRLGGWQVISWALVLSVPVMLPLALWCWPPSLVGIGQEAWLGLAYVSVFSMLVGFVFWYRGLALGGIAAVGQLQLLQPFLGLALAAGLLHEPVTTGMLVAMLGALVCVTGAKRYAAAG